MTQCAIQLQRPPSVAWQRAYWNDLSDRPGLRPVIDPEDETSDKNRRINLRHDQAVRRLLRRLGLDRWDSVLDFGCGIGCHHALLSSIADRYIGVDIAEGMLERAPGDVRLIDGVHLPVADAEVECVFSFWVLQHVVDDDELVEIAREFRRVVRPGGSVILCERSAGSAEEPGRPQEYIRRRAPNHYVDLFRRSGFEFLRRDPIAPARWWRVRQRRRTRDTGDFLYAFAA